MHLAAATIPPELSHLADRPEFGGYVGLRMSADEFLDIPEDGAFYELIDGVVVVSPSPVPLHQEALIEVAYQIHRHVKTHRVGKAYVEVDVHLGRTPDGRDVVYRPEIVFIRSERVKQLVQPLKK